MWKGWSMVYQHLSSFPTACVCVRACTPNLWSRWWISIQLSKEIIPLDSCLWESLKDRIYKKKNSFTAVDDLLRYHLTHSLCNLDQNSKKKSFLLCLAGVMYVWKFSKNISNLFFFLFILFYFIYVMDVINVDPMSNFHMKWNACTSYGDMQEIRLRDQ